MVRASDDCHASSAVTSLTEPSLKDAIAFNWVVLPMATAGCEGVIVTDSNAAATAPFPAGAAPPATALDASLAALEELTWAAGARATELATYVALTTPLGT